MKHAWLCSALMVVIMLVGSLSLPDATATSPARPHLYHVDVGVKVFWEALTVNKFNPDKLTIHAGDSVQWTNVLGNQPQTVTFGPILVTPPLITRADVAEINPRVVQAQGGHVVGDVTENVYSSGALVSGQRGLSTSYTFTFRTPGTYLYRSLFHPSMSGEIDVVPANQPASPNAVDHGPTMFDGLKSAGEVLQRAEPYARLGGSGSSVEVLVGTGNAALSFNTFTLSGIVVKIGSTVRWTSRETSGDLHALVFGALTNAEQGGLVPLYTGVAADGGLIINPDYTTPSVPDGTEVFTDTFSAPDTLYTSGILYGSFINYPSTVPSSFSLTFQSLGQFYYVDPFHSTMLGLVNVVP